MSLSEAIARNRRINVSVCLELCKRSVKLNSLPPLLVHFLDGSFHDPTLFCNQRVFMWGAVGQASNTHFSYLMQHNSTPQWALVFPLHRGNTEVSESRIIGTGHTPHHNAKILNPMV